jgi:transcriptional regulator with PAS, ATPase and Fis domain
MVAEGSFREDLFFRVNTFEIHLPPLRERKEDIPDLARFLIARHLNRPDVPATILAPDAVEKLLEHEWSGNVRELANALEHAVILSDGNTITAADLPGTVKGQRSGAGGYSVGSHNHAKTLREIEMEVIYHVLEKHNGDKPKAADELGIALKTLHNKLNQDQAKSAVG